MINYNCSHGHGFAADVVARMYGLDGAVLKEGGSPGFYIWILPDGTTGHLSINGATQYRDDLGRHVRLPLPGWNKKIPGSSHRLRK